MLLPFFTSKIVNDGLKEQFKEVSAVQADKSRLVNVELWIYKTISAVHPDRSRLVNAALKLNDRLVSAVQADKSRLVNW